MKDEHPRVVGLRASEREARLWRVLMVILAVATWLAAIQGVRSVYDRALAGFGLDFYEFWLAGDVLRAHEASGRHEVLEFYTDAAHFKIGERYVEMARSKSRRQREAAAARKVLDTPSSPFFYWVFSILTPGDYDHVYNVYIVFSLACMAGTLTALAWRLRYSVAGMGAAVALASISAPVYSDFQVVNLNFPELTVCSFYLLLRARARRPTRLAAVWLASAGAVMGLLTAFKPNLLLFPVLLGVSGFASRRWRGVLVEAGGFAIALAGGIAVSSWAFGGTSCWVAWGRIVLYLGGRPTMPSFYGNFSLTRNIYEATGHNLINLFTAVGVMLAIVAIWLGRRSQHILMRHARSPVPASQSMPPGNGGIFDRDCEFRHDLAIFGIAAAVTFVTSGLAWLHYPILLFPFLLLAASRARPGRIGIPSEIARYVLVLIVIVLLMFPPLEDIRRLLPFHIDVNTRSWIHCSQAAVAVTLGLGLWFESSFFGKMTETRNENKPI